MFEVAVVQLSLAEDGRDRATVARHQQQLGAVSATYVLGPLVVNDHPLVHATHVGQLLVQLGLHASHRHAGVGRVDQLLDDKPGQAVLAGRFDRARVSQEGGCAQ